MPLLLLLLLIPELITIALIVLDVHLVKQWLDWKNTYADEHARHCLWYAIGVTAYLLFGKLPMSWIVSKYRKNEDEPKQERSGNFEQLSRPDGTIIHIESQGKMDGPPILFVHGWNENLTAWYYQKKHFSQTNKVILIDLPGLGKSKGPDNKDYSLPKMATDLKAVIDHLKLDNVVLWGHSIGGMVILTYCTQIEKNVKEKVRGVILQHTTFTDPTKTSILSGLLTAIEKPVLYPICYIMIALWPLVWLNKWMSYLNGNTLLSTRFSTFAGSQTHAQLDFVSLLSTIAPPQVFARGMLGMMKTYDVSANLKDLAIPALILGAKHDRLTKLTASQFMHNNIPGSELVVLTPAGHQGLIERHVESINAGEKFIHALK